jgi:bacteriocin biosynthesis cyclodehydratase domain-containing protein
MTPGTGDSRRPRLSLPFTILAEPDTVRLVAGEDFRYTLTGEGLDRWLPALLSALDGRRSVAEALAAIEEPQRAAAAVVLERLYGERVLVEGSAADAHASISARLQPEGRGALLEDLAAGDPASAPLSILCQDRLDYDEALSFNRRCLDGDSPWMWATFGPMERGYVSPVFLPSSGPCLACLLGQFRRRSPAPEIYDALLEQGRSGKAIQPVPFPSEGVGILRDLIRWKAALLAETVPPAALYRLQVLDARTLEVSSHRVFLDPECGECRGRRR